MNITVKDLLGMRFSEKRNFDLLKETKFSGVSTDTRTLKRREIFFALRGESFDGHKFVDVAFKMGAACVVIDERAGLTLRNAKPLLVVPDTTVALGQLANAYRKKFTIPVIAVAGSNGKTTTKEMITAVLNTTYSVLTTQGNHNNHIGVPQTLFRLNKNHDAAVVEIGTNHFGELSYLCGILEPTHGIITNIGHEHLEFFGDLEGVAKAEGELFTALANNGIGFVNADDKYIIKSSKRLKKKVSYGFSGSNVNIGGTFEKMSNSGCATFSVRQHGKKPFNVALSAPGNHAMSNALAAAAVGAAFRITPGKIQSALKRFRAVTKRMEIKKIAGITFVNDTYNANPDSVLSALETLCLMKCKGKKIVILGDMLELGATSKREHKKIGDAVTAMGFEYLLTYGPMAKYIHDQASVKKNFWYDRKDELSKYAAGLVTAGDIVLVKGSRGMKMEEVVSFLQTHVQHTYAKR